MPSWVRNKRKTLAGNRLGCKKVAFRSIVQKKNGKHEKAE
jgi:hypothetical protein